MFQSTVIFLLRLDYLIFDKFPSKAIQVIIKKIEAALFFLLQNWKGLTGSFYGEANIIRAVGWCQFFS